VVAKDSCLEVVMEHDLVVVMVKSMEAVKEHD
jgi:hypothetical protein